MRQMSSSRPAAPSMASMSRTAASSSDAEPPVVFIDPVPLRVRKLARPEKPYATMILALCEEDDSRAWRYVSRLMLRPGCYPPKFVDEVDDYTLQRKVPGLVGMGAAHGKVVTASYLLEQMAVTVLGVMSIFGDAISDVYMVHSLFTDDFYSQLTIDVFGSDAKHVYLWLTAASLSMWLGASGLSAAYLLRHRNSEYRAESRARSALHFFAMWFVLAFNVPFWMLSLANSTIILKVFCVIESSGPHYGREHYGLVYATGKLTDWKGTGKHAVLFQLPALLLEDIVYARPPPTSTHAARPDDVAPASHPSSVPSARRLSCLNIRIYMQAGFTLPGVVSLTFAALSLFRKLTVHGPFLRARFCKRCVNADGAGKYDNVARDIVHVPYYHPPPPAAQPAHTVPPPLVQSFSSARAYDDARPMSAHPPAPCVSPRTPQESYSDAQTPTPAPAAVETGDGVLAGAERAAAFVETPGSRLGRSDSTLVHLGAQTPLSTGERSHTRNRPSFFSRQPTSNLPEGVAPFVPPPSSPKRRASIKPSPLQDATNHSEVVGLLSERDDDVVEAAASGPSPQPTPPADVEQPMWRSWPVLSASGSAVELPGPSSGRQSFIKKVEAFVGPSPITSRILSTRRRATADHTPSRSSQHWDVENGQRAKSNAHELGRMRYSPSDTAQDHTNAMLRSSSRRTSELDLRPSVEEPQAAVPAGRTDSVSDATDAALDEASCSGGQASGAAATAAVPVPPTLYELHGEAAQVLVTLDTVAALSPGEYALAEVEAPRGRHGAETAILRDELHPHLPSERSHSPTVYSDDEGEEAEEDTDTVEEQATTPEDGIDLAVPRTLTLQDGSQLQLEDEEGDDEDDEITAAAASRASC